MPQRQDLHLEGARERKTENSIERTGERALNIGLASHLRTPANLMIPE
jgi:hypothetical protein